MSPKKNIKSSLLTVFGLFLSLIISLANPAATFAKTKTYGVADKTKDYLFNQAANWWGDGEGSKKNGSSLNAFAAAVSVLNETKISPAAIAKIAYTENIWNLSGAAPSDIISRLAANKSINAELVKAAAGSSVSKRLKAVAKYIKDGSVVVARATGSKPFNTGESGGHYVTIFGWKSNNKIYVYDPAKAKGSWVSGKSFIKKMKKNVMFYALKRGTGAEVKNIDYFDSEYPIEPEGDDYEDEGDAEEDSEVAAPEIADCAANPSNENCSADPADDPTPEGATQGNDDNEREPEGDRYYDDGGIENLSGTALEVFETAYAAAWPTIDESDGSGSCYDSYGNPYNNYASFASKCKASIKREYSKTLEYAGLTPNLSTAQDPANFIAAILISNDAIPSSALNAKNITQSNVYNALDSGKNGWSRVDNPAVGDIVYFNNKFYFWIGETGKNYGNAITAELNSWVPHMETVSLSGTYRVYRYGGGTYTGGGDGGSEGGSGLDDQVPPEDQTEGEAEAGDPESPEAVGEKIAARAMSFSWPYTKYSTDNENSYGKCVKKYGGGSARTSESLSSYPLAANAKKPSLSTYPTGTKCNKTVTPAYARYKGITSASKMNSQSVGSMSFVRNVYSSLGINIGYLSISDLRSKLNNLDNWELIAKNINSTDGLIPGDLLVAKNAAMIYVGDLGGGYGEVAQAYKGKWTPRLTPIFYNDTYVFRLKSGANISESGDCPEEKTIDSVEGNEKVAVAAATAAWPYTGGSADKIGHCLNGSKLVSYPAMYTYSIGNEKLGTKAKSASTLAKERKNTGCLGTPKCSISKTNNMNFIYSVLEAVGIKRFSKDPDADAVWFGEGLINTYPNDWEMVTKKLTSKNKSSLKLGDIIIAKTTKNKNVISQAAIYIGKYGKNCLGVNYGDIVTATAKENPYVLPLAFEKKTEYWVIRPRSSAWDEPEAAPENPPEEEPVGQEEPEPTASTGAQRIAETAMKFSWPFNKYSTSITSLHGKCIYWFPGKSPTNTPVKYPTPYASGSLKDQTNSAAGNIGKIGTYYACANTLTPARATDSTVGVSGLKGKSFSDIVVTDPNDEANFGGYNIGFEATISGLADKVVFKTLKAAKGYDCIRFVTDVLRAAGTSTKKDVYGSSELSKQPGWKKIGSSIKNDVKALKSSSTLVTDQGITLEPGDVVVRQESQGRHTFIWLGQMGWPYGDRAEGGKDEYVGGLIMDTFIYDHVYNYGNGLNVYRYTGN